MSDKIVIVMDCGATNVRSIAVNEKGDIIAENSSKNFTVKQDGHSDLRVWDIEEIWNKLVRSTKAVCESIDKDKIAGVTATAFGVDFCPMASDGSLLYPMISWQCKRTVEVMKNIDKYMPLSKIYGISALQPMHFNTISKLVWLKENAPEALENMDKIAVISSIFLYRLCGNLVFDTTQAGTTMLTNAQERDFSDEILNAIGFDKSIFPAMVEPGEVVGELHSQAAELTGLPKGLPVIAAGHDTQFAVYGSGAGENEPVLSSGTWEILMVRTKNITANDETLSCGIGSEFDVMPGLYNMGVQWLASGALEWIKRMFYGEENHYPNIYDIMINEARKAEIGSHGVFWHPAFAPGIGPSAPYNTHGTLLGLMMTTERGQVYRAILESLACQAREGLEVLQKYAGFTAEKLIVVGGGSKNTFWNQMKADICGVPVKLINQKETTVLGAALFAMAGAGLYKDADEARSMINYGGETYDPVNKDAYEGVYDRFKTLARDLSVIYKK